VKTGTSQGSRDAWAVAFSDRLLVAVWVGSHDRRRMNAVTGQAGAAPIAHAILDAVMPLRTPTARSRSPSRRRRAPRESATIRLAARVVPADEPVVFLVDGVPVAKVSWPHEFRWTATAGAHFVSAALARRAVSSRGVSISVGD
jgi:membrane carboxypeptidase/penicillin-binding protein PbpC